MIWVGRGLQERQSFRRRSSGSISHSPTPHHLAHNIHCLQETPGEANASPPNNRNKFLNSACRWQLVSQKCGRYLSNNIANDVKSMLPISAFLCQPLYDQPFYTVQYFSLFLKRIVRDTTQMFEQGKQQYFAGLSLTVLSRERKAQSPDIIIHSIHHITVVYWIL